MTDTNAVIAVYDSHTAAEDAVKELQKSGFDMKKLSVVGKDYHTDEQVVGYYNAGDRMKYWGKWVGRFLGRVLGLADWCRILLGARNRSSAGRRSAGGMDRRWPGRRGGSRRFECYRCRSVQYRHTKRQHRNV
jgi:hypothetical protein